MTEQQFRYKVKELQIELNKLIDERVNELCKTPELEKINIDGWGDNYMLPRIFLHALIRGLRGDQ